MISVSRLSSGLALRNSEVTFARCEATYAGERCQERLVVPDIDSVKTDTAGKYSE